MGGKRPQKEKPQKKETFCGWEFCTPKPGIALRFKEKYDTIPLNYVAVESRYAEFIGQNVKFVLRDKPQAVKLPLVFGPGGHKIDAGGLNTAVAQHIGQL